jgi:L-fuculose-phosphate aldolase
VKAGHDIVCVHPDGRIEGARRPSSEYPFHLAILRARADLKAVVHAHVPTLSAFAVARRVPDTMVLPQSRFVCGAVASSAYVLPGSEGLGEVIAERFRSGANCVAMENHGFVFGGATLQEGFERMETWSSPPPNAMPGRHQPIEAQLATAATTAAGEFRVHCRLPAREHQLRRQLCEFARRGYDQRLSLGEVHCRPARGRRGAVHRSAATTAT